tara:strand:- start:885 stop:1037 length:153 start_codon:yes stop_codon:yes gene_type:complete
MALFFKEVGSVSYIAFLERNESAIRALDSVESDMNLIRIRPDKLLSDAFV